MTMENSETPNARADLIKATQEAESTYKAAVQERISQVKALGDPTTWSMDDFELVTKLNADVAISEKSTKTTKTILAGFDADARWNQLKAPRDAVSHILASMVKPFRDANVGYLTGECVVMADGDTQVSIRLGMVTPSTDELVTAIKEALAPHRKLLLDAGFDHLSIAIDSIGGSGDQANLVRVGRAKATTTSVSRPTGVVSTNGFTLGQALVATHKGSKRTCSVTTEGYILDNGQVYKSASGAAKAVTGTSVNGNVFWKVAS